MEHHLVELLKTNDAPDERAIQEIKDRLKAPFEQLRQIDVEVADLHARLKVLKEKQEEIIRDSIADYSALLSPIRRLPNDVLSEIFYHCLPTHRNSLISSSDAPLLLTHVCRKWRDAALSSPWLWTRLHITFSDTYRRDMPGPTGQDDPDMAAIALRKRCEIVKEWLNRSGTCPLSISIFYYARHVQSRPDSRSLWGSVGADDLTRELFMAIVSFQDRWNSLELVMPIELCHILEPMIQPRSLQSLTSVRLQFDAQSQPLRRIDINPTIIASDVLTTLSSAPRIRKVTLANLAYSLPSVHMRRTPLSSFNPALTHFCSSVLFNVNDALELFRQCNDLVHCKIWISAKPEDASFDPTQGAIKLPRLLSFSVIENRSDSATLTRFYSSLDIPRLKWVEHRRNLSGDPIEVDPNTGRPPIVALLEKPHELRKLTLLDPSVFQPVGLRHVLEAVTPNLKHLVLGQVTPRPWHIQERKFSDTPRVFDLDWLVVNPGPTPTALNAVLLPNLEIFEWSLGLVADMTLLRFITSRTGPSLPSELAPLKRVRIMFDRPQEVDVAGEIKLHRGEARGSNLKTAYGYLDELDLDLSYPSKVVKGKGTRTVSPLSSSFGLGTNDDRGTWKAWDIDESVTDL